MAVQHRFAKIFNLRPEESRPVFYLMAFSFFVGLSLSFYFTASNAIFLKHFQPRMISVSYIASGIIVYLAWLALSRVDRRLNISNQLVVKFLFVFITVLAISVSVWIYDTPVLAFIMFTWVRVLVYITLVTFWGLAGKLFDIRQGKRIFGLIGIGEAISIIIGYFSIPLVLRFLKAPDLLFLSSGTLFICLLIVFSILVTFKEQLTGDKITSGVGKAEVKEDTNYWKLIKKPYFLLISMMAFLPIFGYLFVDFLFLAQTKKEFANNPETIAGFFGIFLGFVAIVELSFKMISGRFLTKYGLKPSLVSLPLILLISIFLAAMFGTLSGGVGLFFAFIAMARLFERSVRGAVYEPAFQLLYQPVPPGQRLIFQNQIEGIPKALGTIITGAVILLLYALPAFNLVSYNWVFLLVLAAWIVVGYKMYDSYRNMLKSKLAELHSDNQNGTDPMMEVISQNLIHAEKNHFDKVYAVCEKAEPILAEKVLEESLMSVPPHVQISFLQKMAEKNITTALKFLNKLKRNSLSTEVLAVVEETRNSLLNDEALPFEQIAEFSNSKYPADRLLAARLLGFSGRYNTFKLLFNLMHDENEEIRKAAIISAGKIKRVELWPHILEYLTDPDYAIQATISVLIIGEPILQDLERFCEKLEGHTQAQLRIIRIFETIGSQSSTKILRKLVNHPDPDIRKQVLLSLSNLEYHAVPSEIPHIKDTIEKTVEYIVWIYASLNDLSRLPQAEDLQMSLYQELEEKKEYVFLLLSLLYESATVRHIRENIESKDPKAKVYALEIGEMIIADDVKELFFPVFEELPINERLTRFGIRFPQKHMEPQERLSDITNRSYTRTNRWTKACAINLLGKMGNDGSGSIETLLAANIAHPDQMLGELAAWALYHFNKNYYFDTMIRFDKTAFPRVPKIGEIIKQREKNSSRLLFEKVSMLKNTELFSMLPEESLIRLIVTHPSFLNDDTLKNHSVVSEPDHIQVIYKENEFLSIPVSWLYEYMTGSPEFTQRFFRLFTKQNN